MTHAAVEHRDQKLVPRRQFSEQVASAFTLFPEAKRAKLSRACWPIARCAPAGGLSPRAKVSDSLALGAVGARQGNGGRQKVTRRVATTLF